MSGKISSSGATKLAFSPKTTAQQRTLVAVSKQNTSERWQTIINRINV
jgi:hypothetical protein